MTISANDNDALKIKVRKMAYEGITITRISKELGISWSEAGSYASGWIGTKQKLTRRLKRLAKEPDQAKREKMAEEADKFADFLFDAAKHLRYQVNAARNALNR